jgi:glutaredoxin
MSNKDIIVYSKSNCIYCNKAKSLLKNLNVEYTEKTLESFESPEAMLEDIGRNVRQMPQIKIDGELIGGYNQLVEHFSKMDKVNFKGEVISE